MAAKKFQKGNPGKPKGAVSKVNQDAKALFVKIMEGQVPEIEVALAQIRERSPFNYIVCLSKLMPYFMPKQIDLRSDDKPLPAPIIQILPVNAPEH